MTPIEHVLSALRAKGHTPRRSGDGWTCTCPAHDDRTPSLSINAGDDGRALLHCFAGCTPEAVCAALGLQTSELFPDRGCGPPKKPPLPPRLRPKAGPARQRGTPATEPTATLYATADAAIEALERTQGAHVAQWSYLDGAGIRVGVVARWHSGAGKTFRPVALAEDGVQWRIGSMPTPRPLYRLPALLALPPGSRVWICEGEKATDAACAVGLTATTSPHGSKSAAQADWFPLRGHHVLILPDHDNAGERYAADVARLALAAGARTVRIVRLVDLWAGMPEGGDMADFVEHRGGDVDAIRAEVEALADQAEPEDATPQAPATPHFDLDSMFPSRAKYALEYLAALSRSTQTPVEMPALLGLSIVSAAVCNVARVRGHGDHIEPAQLWGLVLCEPAVRKSAVVSELLAPIVAWEKRRAEELAPEIAEAVQRRKIDEKRLKSIEEQAAKCKHREQADALYQEAVRLAQAMASNAIPTAPVLLASEPTPEALSRQMAANQGRALLASAEADALDIIQGRYSGSRNYGILLKGHAGDAVRAQRVGRPGDVIDHPALALALCVQPQAVRDLWADPHAAGRGLLARFAVVLPRDRIGYRDVRPPRVPDAVRAHWRAAIDRLLTCEPSDAPLLIGLDAQADALFHEFQRRTESALGVGDLAERRAWGGKLCGLLLRIALTLHALESWALAGRPEDYPTIGLETMRAGIAWADYLALAEGHARELLTESDERRESRRLVEWIEGKGGTVTVRDLTRGPREFRGDPDGAARALGELVAAGVAVWVHEDHGPKGGRPAERVRLVSRRGDAGDGDETPALAGNHSGSVTVAAVAKSTDACEDWGVA